LANQTFINKCKTALNTAFDYANNQSVGIKVYQPEITGSKFIIAALQENVIKYPPPFRCEILTTKKFIKNGKNIVINLHPNNYNIYDATWQMNNFSVLYDVFFKSEIFEIFFMYHYTNYKEVRDDVTSVINQVFYERFGNIVKFD
jgi:hypothetical protein